MPCHAVQLTPCARWVTLPAHACRRSVAPLCPGNGVARTWRLDGDFGPAALIVACGSVCSCSYRTVAAWEWRDCRACGRSIVEDKCMYRKAAIALTLAAHAGPEV